jgi:hypothetical protein
MDVAAKISALRKWLREDDTRLQSSPSRSAGSVASGERAAVEYNFNDHSDWHDTGTGGWKDWPNWTNGS